MQKAMMNNPGNVDEAMFACIKKWLNGIPNRPVTWEYLLKALEEAELKEPSKELKAKLTLLEGLSRCLGSMVCHLLVCLYQLHI